MEDDVRLNFDDLLDSADSPQEVTEESNTYEPIQESDLGIESNNEEPEAQEGEVEEETIDYSDNSLYSFLQSRGIKDPSKIQVSDEDGNVEEVDFSSLTSEEQLEILQEISDPGLTEEEISTINYLRHNRMNMNQVLEAYAKQTLEAYLNEHPEDRHQKVYAIDDYSDDDLYLVDLKRRYPDFTDEELLSKLDAAKGNEELFKKEADVLRNTYKAQEDQAEADRVQQEQQQAQDLRDNLMNAASNFNEIQLDYTDDKSDSLVIEEADKQQMISYLLDQDENGKSQLVRDLEDPDSLIELAWLRTQGAEVLSSITKYWKETLAAERAENKKLRAQIEKINKKGDSTVVIPKAPSDKTDDAQAYAAWDNSGLI